MILPLFDEKLSKVDKISSHIDELIFSTRLLFYCFFLYCVAILDISGI